MRDRLLALAARRPSRIRDDDFDVPIIQFDGFDVRMASDTLAGPPDELTIAGYDHKTRMAMATMCVDLTKLGVCLGHILHSQYTVTGSLPSGQGYLSGFIVTPKRSEQQAWDLVRCDKELVDWLQDRDPRSRYTPESEQERDRPSRITRLHQSLLRMSYLTGVTLARC